jgi:LysR family transcriptional regulator (chromosome initiation inhibitor)
MALDSHQLATFAAVIQEGSFEAAAKRLRVTASAVSQRVKALEQAAGQTLIRRTKPCVPTQAGLPLLRLAGQIEVLESEALAIEPIRAAIVVNADSLATWFMPALSQTQALIDITQEDEEHTTNLLRDGSAMAAVTSKNIAVQGCRVIPLGSMRYLAVATGALAAEHDFRTTPVVALNRKDRLQHRFMAANFSGRDPDPPVHYVPSVWAFGEAIRLGLGWGMVPRQLAGPDLAAGRLVELRPGHHLDVPLYWQCWRLESATLTTLTAAVIKAAAQALLPAKPARQPKPKPRKQTRP